MVGAGRRARRAGKVLRESVAGVADAWVLSPIERELEQFAAFCAALKTPRGK